MDYPACDICGAVVLDTRLHERWHAEQDRKVERAIADAQREQDRRFDMYRRAG